MKIFVDDDRPAPSGWTLVRTVAEALKLLGSGKVEEISLDHDIILHDDQGHYVGQKSYMPVALFIAKMPEKLRPKTVIVHTANVKAGDKMMEVLKGKVPVLMRDTHYERKEKP